MSCRAQELFCGEAGRQSGRPAETHGGCTRLAQLASRSAAGLARPLSASLFAAFRQSIFLPQPRLTRPSICSNTVSDFSSYLFPMAPPPSNEAKVAEANKLAKTDPAKAES